MNNSNRFVFIYFCIISFFCKGMDQLNGHQKFSVKMVSPGYIQYINNEDFLVAGFGGFEIHRPNQKEKSADAEFLGHLWKPLDDREKIIWVDGNKNVFYCDSNEDKDEKAIKLFTSLYHLRIECGAFDGIKNTIFLGCNTPKRGTIRKYNYPSTECTPLHLNENVYCCAMALNSKKDILFLLDSTKNISLRDPNNIATVLKEIMLPFETPVWNVDHKRPLNRGSFSLMGSKIAIGNEYELFIVDYCTHENNIKHHLKASSYGGKDGKFSTMALNSKGFFAILNREYIPTLRDFSTSHEEAKSYKIDYWDTETAQKIDTQHFKDNILCDFCFRDDGREVAIAGLTYSFTMSVDPVIKKHLLPLWMALSQIKRVYYLPEDIIKHCMYIFLNSTYEK